MPSITYWIRLEPDPRSDSIRKSLSARIYDSLWFLTRQWQVGEFMAEDAASPAFVQIAARQTPFRCWRAGQQPSLPAPLSNQAPLEELAEREPFSANDLSIQVELGQIFETLLGQEDLPDSVGLSELIEAIRKVYRVENNRDEEDQATGRFLNICAGRAIAGANLYLDAKLVCPTTPDGKTTCDNLPEMLRGNPIVERAKDAVLHALENLIAWTEEVFGEICKADAPVDPPAWRPERLEYEIEVIAATPDGGEVALSAHPDREGGFGWQAFDLSSTAATCEMPLPPPAPPAKTTVIPAHVHPQGAPNARWWDFENNMTDFGAIVPDKTDLAKLVVTDFLLIQSNNWFVVPYDLPAGTLCHVDSLVVCDVFGGLTLVERADDPAILLRERWTMFSTAVSGDQDKLANFFILPPSAFAARQFGVTLEEVRFIRDEMANMAWAIEHTIENRIGQPQPGFEGRQAAGGPAPPPPGDGDRPPLRYLIQTTTPGNWNPLIAVSANEQTGDIAFELGAILDPMGKEINPRGRILTPAVSPYRVREEEVPRSGARVRRSVNRARWIDGSTFLWIAREKSSGMGEGNSGLQFDLAIPNR